MTDPILYLIEGTTLAGTLLIAYLYLFSTPLREVTASANYNFRRWRNGTWSVKTGRSVGGTDPIHDPTPIPEID